MNAKEKLAAKMKMHQPDRSADEIWKEICVMPWADRMQLYADLSVAETRLQWIDMSATLTGTRANILATIESSGSQKPGSGAK